MKCTSSTQLKRIIRRGKLTTSSFFQLLKKPRAETKKRALQLIRERGISSPVTTSADLHNLSSDQKRKQNPFQGRASTLLYTCMITVGVIESPSQGGGDASVDTHSPERPLQTHSSPHARSFTRSNSNTNKRCRENMQRRASDCALLGNAKPNPTLKRRVGTLNSCTILHHYLTFAHYHNQKKTSTSGSLLKPQKQPTESRLLGTKAAASPNAKKWNSPPGMRAGSGNTRRCGEILTTHTPTFATNLKLQIVPTKGLLPANHRTRHTMSHDRKTYPLN